MVVSCALIVNPTIATITIVAPHKMPLREPKLRVVLRSIHGIASTTTRKIVGMMIVAMSSIGSGIGPMFTAAGVSASNPNRERKYHAGYGTNPRVRRIGFGVEERRQNQREKDDDHEDQERNRRVHEHLVRPEAPALELARIVGHRTGRAVMAKDRQVRANQ